MSTHGQEEGGPSAAWPLLALLLLIILGSVVVAASVEGLRLLHPAADLGGTWALVIRIAGGVAVLAGAAVLLGDRTDAVGAGAPGRAPGRGPVANPVRNAAMIMGLVTAIALLVAPPLTLRDLVRPRANVDRSDRDRRGGPGDDRGSTSGLSGEGGGARASSGGGIDPQVSGVSNDRQHEPLLRRMARNLPLLAILAVVLVSALMLRRHLNRRYLAWGADLPPPAEEMEAGLEASLDLVAAPGGDPRRQVTAAYHRLLASLTAAGAPRLTPEAPHEHLYRVLGPLGANPEPLHELAALYVMAAFSERAVTDRHRATAVEALRASLEGLKALRALALSDPAPLAVAEPRP
jgi:hypothetical protein